MAPGLLVAADGGIEVGTNVALVAPLPIGFIDATCRIVAVVNEPDRFGFAYGTLGTHPQRGEESFIVTRSGDASRFDVVATHDRCIPSYVPCHRSVICSKTEPSADTSPPCTKAPITNLDESEMMLRCGASRAGLPKSPTTPTLSAERAVCPPAPDR